MSNQPGCTIIAERDKKLRAARKLFFATIEATIAAVAWHISNKKAGGEPAFS
jgi:hypothetical protein